MTSGQVGHYCIRWNMMSVQDKVEHDVSAREEEQDNGYISLPGSMPIHRVGIYLELFCCHKCHQE